MFCDLNARIARGRVLAWLPSFVSGKIRCCATVGRRSFAKTESASRAADFRQHIYATQSVRLAMPTTWRGNPGRSGPGSHHCSRPALLARIAGVLGAYSIDRVIDRRRATCWTFGLIRGLTCARWRRLTVPPRFVGFTTWHHRSVCRALPCQVMFSETIRLRRLSAMAAPVRTASAFPPSTGALT